MDLLSVVYPDCVILYSAEALALFIMPLIRHHKIPESFICKANTCTFWCYHVFLFLKKVVQSTWCQKNFVESNLSKYCM